MRTHCNRDMNKMRTNSVVVLDPHIPGRGNSQDAYLRLENDWHIQGAQRKKSSNRKLHWQGMSSWWIWILFQTVWEAI